MSPSNSDALARLEHAGRIAPPLREAYRAGRLSWAQALLLLPLLRREDAAPWQVAWVERAQQVSRSSPRTAAGRTEAKTPRAAGPQARAQRSTRRSHGGSDALSNRTTLCVWHHQRGEHAKVVRCRGEAPGRLRFALGLRPGSPPLARYRSGDVRVA